MKRKYQVFISSTYTDLVRERQAAVEAILAAGHIPAGMELFTAGNLSQMATIKRWIEQSDVFLLILGGRYGSIEEVTQCSYVELEYKYAIECNIPVFALVMTDEYIGRKVAADGKKAFEYDYQNKYILFKKLVLSKMIAHCDDIKDIKINVFTGLSTIIEQHDLSGWVKATEVEGMGRIESLLLENTNLRNKSIYEASNRMSLERQLGLLRDGLPDKLLDQLSTLNSEMLSSGIDLTSQANKQRMLDTLIAKLSPPPPPEPKYIKIN